MNSSPSVILKSKFVTSGKSSGEGGSYNDYLNYMNRNESDIKLSEYESYQDYMKNDEKTNSLFDMTRDNLSKKDMDLYKSAFKRSQDKGSIMWQDVISFDNEWLKEIGVIKGNKVDDEKLKNITRRTMSDMLNDEKISDSAIWTGAIHYNTENIHIHMATVQTHNFKERGKRKPQTISKMKSNVMNRLIDRTKQNEKINTFIRDKLVQSKRTDPTTTIKNKISNRDMVKQFNSIYSSLPNDKSKWKYNMNSMKDIRPEIDKLTDMYIEKNFKNEYKEFKNQVNENVNFYKKTYGNNSQAEKYKEKVYEDMYSRMGNTILTELRSFDKSKKSKESFSRKKSFKEKVKMKKLVNNSIYKIDRYMKDELQNFKNQREFEQLENESEMNR